MVAASKLRRAQERIQQARPFAAQMHRVLNSLAARVDQSAHPLLDERQTPKAGGSAAVVITADRGLCGSFNTNVIKAAASSLPSTAERQVRSAWSGAAAATTSPAAASTSATSTQPVRELHFEDAQAIAEAAIEAFVTESRRRVPGLQRVQSVMVQRVVVEQLLPIPRLESAPRARPAAARSTICTSRRPRIVRAPDSDHVEVQVFQALLESNAAFFAAQMTAMDAATSNSGEMIDSLRST